MIAVISDIHFEEEASDVISTGDPAQELAFRRNLDPKAYHSFIAAMADELVRRRLRNFDLVIAGDLFDLNRTALWFSDELRPYCDLEAVSSPLETKVMGILNATVAEPSVNGALQSFQLLARGRYLVQSGAGGPEERDFPADHIAIHYVPGNHDRLVNATPQLRQRVRELLGTSGTERFPHVVLFNNPGVLIRHGHEYDVNNFASDLQDLTTIPPDLPETMYSAAPFGDFVTIDVAVRLPHLWRAHYGDRQIIGDRILSALYLRLLQFDDVRPQSALLDFLLDDSAGQFAVEEAWERLLPVLQELLDGIHGQSFFRAWLRERAQPWTPVLLDVARLLLEMGGARNAPAREITRRLSHMFLGSDAEGPERFAAREELVHTGQVRMVLAGHTHSPQVSLIAADAREERFYINTGTWRTRIPATDDRRTFGHMKALTYVMLFAADEDPDRAGPNAEFGSFDYWTGYTRHWPRSR
jgi:UDP-2,3-diacylglucosamine pyrophosphatase LpxH